MNKQELAEALIVMTEPFRAARAQGSASRYPEIERILQDGAARARAVAK